MIMLGTVFIVVSCAIAYAFLNKGPKDKESDRSQAYWARFEKK